MSGRRCVLVVDDVEINRIILRTTFEHEYDVLEAEDGMSALQLMETYREDLAVVLLDIVMPRMNGIEVLQEMAARHLTGEIPVVIISGEQDDQVSLAAFELGVSDLINKPFNAEVVYRRVNNIIALYSNKREMQEKLAEQRETLRKQSQRLHTSNQFLIDALCTTVEFRSMESGTHVKRVRLLVRGLLQLAAPEYGFTPEEIDIISSASSMHDIGKVAIPDAILEKPGAFTPEEYDIMKTHTLRGCEILENLKTGDQLDPIFYDYCYEICRHHHERWDGSGYPDGLKGDEIPFVAQATALADCYDALTSDRIYRPALTHDVAVKMIMNGECGAFNPRMLSYLELLDDALSSGELLEVAAETNTAPATGKGVVLI